MLSAGIGLVVGAPAMIALSSSATAAGASTWRASLGYPSDQTITVVPGTNGAQQDAFVDRDGYVQWRTEHTGAWSTWTDLGNTDRAMTRTGPLTWAPGEFGSTQELFAEATDQVWVTWESGSTWSDWTRVGTTGIDDFYDTGVTYAPGSAGSVQEAFALADGHLYESAQSTTGAWSAWAEVGSNVYFEEYGSHVTYAPGTNGSVQELFGWNVDDGETWVTWESPTGSWRPWSRFGTADSYLYGPLTYGPGTNGSLQEIFGVTDTTYPGAVVVSWESPNGSWSPWAPMGYAAGENSFYDAAVTVAPGSNGSLQEIFATTIKTTLWSVWVDWENPGGTWSGWTDMTGSSGPYFDHETAYEYWWLQVTYAPGSNGSLQELFATSDTYTGTATGDLTYVDWENPGGTWSGWVPFGAAYTG